MKAEDVMKALECCTSGKLRPCDPCPYSNDCRSCWTLHKNALALLREKDAEIERLNALVVEGADYNEAWVKDNADLRKAIKTTRSEAITEFAERLKEAPIKCGLPLLGLQTKGEIEEYFNGIMLQVRDAIDGIAKELKGEQE